MVFAFSGCIKQQHPRDSEYAPDDVVLGEEDDDFLHGLLGTVSPHAYGYIETWAIRKKKGVVHLFW